MPINKSARIGKKRNKLKGTLDAAHAGSVKFLLYYRYTKGVRREKVGQKNALYLKSEPYTNSIIFLLLCCYNDIIINIFIINIIAFIITFPFSISLLKECNSIIIFPCC